MSTTQPLSPTQIVAGATAAGALGYAIAVWLARTTDFAERVEEDRYCREPAVPVTAGESA